MRRPGIVFPILLILACLLGITILLAWSIGLGWLLGKIFEFTLFEGSLLALISSIAVVYVLFRLLSLNPADVDLEEAGLALPAYEIPMNRFYKTDADKTLGAWFTYTLSNNIYIEFQTMPHSAGLMDKAQLQELAIRLAGIIVTMLEHKSVRAKRIRITQAELRKQMVQMDQKPYDEDILAAAVQATNLQLDLEAAETVVRSRLWKRHTDMFDSTL